MTALRNHKPADWRRLNIDHSVRARRCHSRDIYGELQPMHSEEKWPLPIKLFLVGMLGWATWLTIGGVR